MMIDERLKLELYTRGFWLLDLPGKYAVAAQPGGKPFAVFSGRAALDAWIEGQPVMKSQAFLLRRKKRR